MEHPVGVRCDRDQLPKLPVLVVPKDWAIDELELSPLPAGIATAADLEKAIVVHLPLQAFGAYERGRLVRWRGGYCAGACLPTMCVDW